MSRVYRNIATPVTILGLELPDLSAVVVVFLILFDLSDRFFLNLAAIALFYLAIRYLKKGKPPGYALQLAKYLMAPSERSVNLDDSLPTYLSRSDQDSKGAPCL